MKKGDIKSERVGEIGYNKYGTKMKIIEYNGVNDIIVEFQDEHKCRLKSYYSNFKKGVLINPYDKMTQGVGYLGEGQYNSKNTKAYNFWFSIITRGYSKDYKNKKPTYKDVTVCEEWHNFQNFAKWCDENYYEIEGETMAIDKDILYKGNKIYCPEKCIFAPFSINSLFTKRQNCRGDYPIGVCKNNEGKFASSCHYKGRTKNLGLFNTPEEAFYAYKQFKENYIKEVADEYKDKIPQKLYEAMYRYEVEITD